MTDPIVTVPTPPDLDVTWLYCPQGWADILHSLVRTLDAALPNMWMLRGCKEKFGGLDVYLDHPPTAREEHHAIAKRLTTSARDDSRRTCDTCGQPGEPQVVESYLVTVCFEHAAPGNRPGRMTFQVRGV